LAAPYSTSPYISPRLCLAVGAILDRPPSDTGDRRSPLRGRCPASPDNTVPCGCICNPNSHDTYGNPYTSSRLYLASLDRPPPGHGRSQVTLRGRRPTPPDNTAPCDCICSPEFSRRVRESAPYGSVNKALYNFFFGYAVGAILDRPLPDTGDRRSPLRGPLSHTA
jgi:hypothetical protein